MKNIIQIFLYDKNDCEYPEAFDRKYTLDIDRVSNVVISLNVHNRESYKDIINDYDLMQKNFEDDYDLQKLLPNDEEYKDELLKLYNKYIYKNVTLYNELFENNECVYVCGEYRDIVVFLNNNKDALKNKKIIFNNVLSLSDSDCIEYVLKNFLNYNNLYVLLEGNNEVISMKELELTYKSIDIIYEKIKKYNLSTLETLVYVYDLVRNREYKMEEKTESALLSRDLTKVLLGDKIVCLGFANIFDAVLKKMGFSSNLDILIAKDSKNYNHARNSVYLKDKKYNVEGIFYFDPTFDCKKENSNNFLYNFSCFARNKSYMDFKYSNIYSDSLFKYFDYDFVERIENTIKDEGIENISEEDIKKINDISYFIDGYSLVNRELIFRFKHNLFNVTKKDINIPFIIDRLYEYLEIFDYTISNKILLDAIYYVRKIEYYENPDLFTLELSDFYKIYNNSQYGSYLNGIGKLMANIYGFSSIDDVNIDEYVNDTDLEKKIESVKLTKILRNVYEKRK